MKGVVRALCLTFCLAPAASGGAALPEQTQPLDRRLAAEPPENLARDAQREGDAERGAILFYQAYLSCAKCHTPRAAGKPFGPVPARDRPRPSGAGLGRAV